MTYEYKCPHCQHVEDITKPMSACSSIETCPKCSQTMYRQYTAPQINVRPDHYSRVLGTDTASRRNVRDAVKRKEDATGQELVEVGNEKLDKVKPKSHEYPNPEKVLKDHYNNG